MEDWNEPRWEEGKVANVLIRERLSAIFAGSVFMVVGSNPKRGFEERVGGVWKLRFGIVKDSKSKKIAVGKCEIRPAPSLP